MPSPTFDTSRISPVSLLWAHQLRREHKALVGEISILESSLKTVHEGLAGLNSRVDVIAGEIKELETVPGKMKSEMDLLRNDITVLKVATDRLTGEGKEMATERKTWEEDIEKQMLDMKGNMTLEGRLMGEIRTLQEQVEEIRRENAERATLIRPSSRYPTCSVPPATQPSPQQTKPSLDVRTTRRERSSSFQFRRLIRMASMEPKTPIAATHPENQPSIVLDSELTIGSSVAPLDCCDFPDQEPRTLGPCPNLRTGTTQSQLLDRGGHHLATDFEPGKQIVPILGRKEEAYAPGHNGPDVGVWKEEQIPQSYTQEQPSKAEPEAKSIRQKKRRVIPIVWSTEEEERAWLTHMNSQIVKTSDTYR